MAARNILILLSLVCAVNHVMGARRNLLGDDEYDKGDKYVTIGNMGSVGAGINYENGDPTCTSFFSCTTSASLPSTAVKVS
jgi:hypothetical protein